MQATVKDIQIITFEMMETYVGNLTLKKSGNRNDFEIFKIYIYIKKIVKNSSLKKNKKNCNKKYPKNLSFNGLHLVTPVDDIDFDVKKSQYFLFILIIKKFIIKNYADHSL